MKRTMVGCQNKAMPRTTLSSSSSKRPEMGLHVTKRLRFFSSPAPPSVKPPSAPGLYVCAPGPRAPPPGPLAAAAPRGSGGLPALTQGAVINNTHTTDVSGV